MLRNLKKDERGFTIIEVLIVLAIAGLIMLIVFLAIPALQRNQRNNTRNSEASRIGALISECMANRNGQTGSCNTAAEIGFDSAQFQQITTATAPGTSDVPGDVPGDAGTFTWGFNRVCEAAGDAATATGANARSGVVLFALEPTSGSGVISRCISV